MNALLIASLALAVMALLFHQDDTAAEQYGAGRYIGCLTAGADHETCLELL